MRRDDTSHRGHDRTATPRSATSAPGSAGGRHRMRSRASGSTCRSSRPSSAATSTTCPASASRSRTSAATTTPTGGSRSSSSASRSPASCRRPCSCARTTPQLDDRLDRIGDRARGARARSRTSTTGSARPASSRSGGPPMITQAARRRGRGRAAGRAGAPRGSRSSRRSCRARDRTSRRGAAWRFRRPLARPSPTLAGMAGVRGLGPASLRTPRLARGLRRARTPPATSSTPTTSPLLGDAAWWLGETPESMAVAEDVYQRLVADGAPTRRPPTGPCGWRSPGAPAATCRSPPPGSPAPTGCSADLPPGPATASALYLEAAFDLDLEGDPGPAEAAAAERRGAAPTSSTTRPSAASRWSCDGMAAVRRGETAARLRARSTRRCCPCSPAASTRMWAGDIYCTTIHLCDGLADLARMRDWTEALARWANPLSPTPSCTPASPASTSCSSSAPRAAGTSWRRSSAAQSESLVGAHGWLSGTGYYELGEVRRLRGDRDGARAAYDRARSFGSTRSPGRRCCCERRATPRARWPSCASRSPSRAGSAGRGLLLPAVELALETGDPAYAAGPDRGARADDRRRSTAPPVCVARAAQARAAGLLADG